jgi:hypothetical protein
MYRKLVIGCCTAALSVGMIAVMSIPAEAAAKSYSNCKKLNKVYKHGVGKPGAHDHTSGTPVTNFTRNKAVYKKNTGRDRDKDGIACEKK